jgi:hypothetical protein
MHSIIKRREVSHAGGLLPRRRRWCGWLLILLLLLVLLLPGPHAELPGVLLLLLLSRFLQLRRCSNEVVLAQEVVSLHSSKMLASGSFTTLWSHAAPV